MNVRLQPDEKTLLVKHVLTYNNTSNDTLKEIVLNDWNNAFSSKNSALARRFSDEFTRAFHLATDEDRGSTTINSIIDTNFTTIQWERPKGIVDLVKLHLNHPILPCSKQTITLFYNVKIPNAKFTKYGFIANEHKFILKHWYLSPSRYENKQFVLQSNENLDDIPNAFSDYEIEFELPEKYTISSNLEIRNNHTLLGFNKPEATVVFEISSSFKTYKNEFIEVSCGLQDTNINELEKALLIDKITRFTQAKLGRSLASKIMISQEDYQRQPFYGLNQLPRFLSPFPDELMFELKFLKTYLNNYLKENIQLNPRKEYWIYDGIQVFLMMHYIKDYYPELKMTGNLANMKLLKSYHFITLPFNQQYNYLYMMMARKNLDQSLNVPKNKLIKFNEQIASKYRAGLSLNYLDDYLGNATVLSSIQEFIQENQYLESNSRQFEILLEKNAAKKTDWFFRTLIERRDLIDYTFGKVTKTKDTIAIKVINKTHTQAPIALYQLKNNEVVHKIWLNNIRTDSVVLLPRMDSDKLVLNYYNETPEYNLRNNWKSLKGFFSNNRPIKLNFMKDLEEPYYNQIFYVPEVDFNAYDGLALGMKISNRSMLNKPFTYSATPMYSSNTGKLVGKATFILDKNCREEGRLYNIKYILRGSQFHYAPDAMYTYLVPTVQFLFRDKNLRTNKSEYIQLRQVYINREQSPFINANTKNYNVFNAKYGNHQSEGTKNFSFSNDLQLSSAFGKLSGEIHFRKLFENNRQISLRLYAGTFMYNSPSSTFFSFGLDRPNDYMFDYNLLGRSETTGIYSQQYVYAEGGFKSKLATRFANQWMTTLNGTFKVWNWIQVYGDAGLLKNKHDRTQFVYDSGVHFNLVPDYFELFFPIYSSNGLAFEEVNYGEKIRFVVTLSPKTLVSLFTRKWF